MEIKVTFDHGRLVFNPDPAYVNRGEPVSWTFSAGAVVRPLRWTVYFHRGSPFRHHATDLIVDTASHLARHSGRTSSMSADDPGDYKYGVRLDDATTKAVLADDDPWLIVSGD